MESLNIPVGVSDFSEIRQNNYYYIDKTGLIIRLLNTSATKVTLITRPRRFGKTLGMSMLAAFFDIRKNNVALFDGLEISRHTSLCDQWMNRYPTLFISFKRVDGLDFPTAYGMLCATIADVCAEHRYLLDSHAPTDYDKELIRRILHNQATPVEIRNSLLVLTRAMSAHYDKPVILLIDEYDVPVAKSTNHGYYQEMMDVMKGLMQALKDNSSLRFSVITGCLKMTTTRFCAMGSHSLRNGVW